MKTILAVVMMMLFSCTTTEKAKLHFYKPVKSGSYRVTSMQGNFATCEGLYKPVFVSDTVQVGEYITLESHRK